MASSIGTSPPGPMPMTTRRRADCAVVSSALATTAAGRNGATSTLLPIVTRSVQPATMPRLAIPST